VADLGPDDLYAYNLSVRVTNNTGQEIGSGVAEQVILSRAPPVTSSAATPAHRTTCQTACH